MRKDLRSWLKEMIMRVGVTSIFVTHDQDEAIEVADEIIITNRGTIEQVGTPIEIYKKPANSFVAEFIGQSTSLDKNYNLKGFSSVGNLEKAVIRPEFITVKKLGDLKQYMSAAEEGIVQEVLFRGSYIEVKVNINGLILTADLSLDEPQVQVNEKVNVLINRLYAFEDNETKLVENAAMKDSNPIFI